MEKYSLLITEKPEAARRIALALDYEGKPKKLIDKGVPYFIAYRDKKLVVVSALGHLYTVVHERGGRDYYPVFSFKWEPRYLVEKGAKKVRAWIKIISKLADGAEEFLDASDYDLEGSLIGYCVLSYACKGKEKVAKRMKFSTLTKKELEKAYDELLPQLDFGLIEAGKTRHEIDWLYGVNLSRALTLSANRWSGRYTTLTTGRVQGPTLKFLVEREKEIRCFVPMPYWSIKAEADIKGSVYDVEYERRRIEKKTEADAVVRACKGKTGEIKRIDVRKFRIKPPSPFDLSSLQAEAYNSFGYTPRQTLDIAQRLYLEALISYPRTGSQKLPPVIDYTVILTELSKERNYKNPALQLLKKNDLKPREGKKKDPAHPAIYPTGNMPERPQNRREKRVFDLVIRRFMAVFGDPSVKQSINMNIEFNGHVFHLRGGRVLEEGWTRFYKPYVRAEGTPLPIVKEGEEVIFRKLTRVDKFTSPPTRYNPSSLLKKMDEIGIGTKATRADIIEALYRRGYITDRGIVVTDLGFDLTEVLDEYCPDIVSVELTKELEEKMDRIQNNEEKSERVLIDAVDRLMPVLEELKEGEEAVGKALSNAIKRARMRDRIVGKCPICETGTLMILHSRKTGKRFIGCTNYFKGLCKTSFPLPQRGTAKSGHKNCRTCGWPLVQIRLTKERKPWLLCFNTNCKSNKGKS